METHEKERVGHMEKHKLSSGDQRENTFQNGDLSCEMYQNTSLKIPFEGEQTQLSGKRKCNVRDFQDVEVSGRTSPGQSPYQCTVCRKSFRGSSDLLRHQCSPRAKKKMHRAKKKMHQCTQCEKSFSRASTLTQHQAVHRRQRLFKCSNCGDSFTRSSSLILHRKTHEGEKPFVCTQCSWHFERASELLAHLRLHT